MNSKNRKVTGRGKSDPMNSLYKQVIFLTDHPSNRVQTLTGYSKGEKFNESKDQIYALAAFIRRMYCAGKFNPQKVKRIEYYRYNPHEGQYSDFILVCEPHTYHFTNDMELVNNDRFCEWIRNFYNQITSPTGDASKILMKPERIAEEDVFSMRYARFKTDIDLKNYCHSLGRRGYPQGQITDFYLKYREKHLANASPEALKQLADRFKSV